MTTDMSKANTNFSSQPLLQIDLSAVVRNYQALAKRAGSAKVGASVKADAYGIGAERIGRVLFDQGCRTFFVAHALEGAALRRATSDQAEIYVFSGPTPGDYPLFFGENLKPVLNSKAQADLWNEVSQGRHNHPPAAALHFDTGINRLGIPEDEQAYFLTQPYQFDIDLVLSHLACSALPDHELNAAQLARFQEIAKNYPDIRKSLANTGGVYLGSDYHFDLVRPGIGLYGGAASINPEREDLNPVVELHAPILQIKTVTRGQTIGYNGSFTAPKDMRIAIVGVGYADGLPVSCSGSDSEPGINVRINDGFVPVVGRVSMDLTILDISGLDVKIGEDAVFFGRDLEEQAAVAGTINYELLTRLGSRCVRRYIQG